ncbi:unnamed protein product [Cladocopium goreaui]|uniref:Uncharacterized protein n=1 Tax=Cladocopium goreaui TaxID=2562237 RepID=A0A9P1M3U4_9DINO|nr:unnamed protein product [Cladocopium goreaui]
MDFVPKSTRSQHDDVPGFSDPLEEWPQQRIYGDFYREPVEDVTRGVSFAENLEPASGFKFGGDYYRDNEDVFKGLTLEQLPEENLFGLDNDQGTKKNPWSWGSATTAATEKSFDEGLAFQVPLLGPEHSGKSSLVSSIQFFEAPCDKFQKSDLPPPKPTDPHWSLEVTNFCIRTPTPWLVGNHLWTFLTYELASPSIKVSRSPKFALKADAFVGNAKCTLKIRVYFIEGETYCVEFQKRTGDGIAFNRAFRQAVKFLDSYFTVESTIKENPSPVCESPISSDAEITPLLDMASVKQYPWLQAESAAALADMAKDQKSAPRLLQQDVIKEIQNLLQSDNTDVAYPTSRLLSNLAKMPRAAEHFAAPGLLPTMIDKVQSGSPAQAVELAQAIHLVSDKIYLDEEQKERVTRQLQLAINYLAPSHRARPLLEKALQKLRRQLA